MVYAFIIHTLNPSVGVDVCRLLYSCTFGAEDTTTEVVIDDASDSQVDIDTRTVKKEQLCLVARQAQAEYSFRKSVASRDLTDPGNAMHTSAGLSDDTGQFEIGTFLLAAGEPFQTEKIAVWLGLANIGLTLVCEKSENRLLAEGMLKLLLRYLQDYVQAVSQPAEVLMRVERVAVIVHQFLPSGRLMFMNHSVIRQMEKDMDSLLRGK